MESVEFSVDLTVEREGFNEVSEDDLFRYAHIDSCNYGLTTNFTGGQYGRGPC